MKEISVLELKEKIDNNEDFQLIDVREPNEYEIVNIGALLIPVGTISTRIDEISQDKKVVVHCKTGRRSAAAIRELEGKFGLQNLYNLKGGILAYVDEVEPELAKY